MTNKILIVESDTEELTKLKNICKSWNNTEIFTAECGNEALKTAETHKTNLVITNFAIKNMDGISLCQKIKNLCTNSNDNSGSHHNVPVIVTASAFSDAAIKRMIACGVDHYMLRPFCNESLKDQVDFLLGLQQDSLVEQSTQTTQAAQVMENFPAIANKKLEERISNIFITMGIPAHIKGYHFLREAIKIIIATPAMIGGITKELYPTIAKAFETTSSKVERAIRHAIEVGWNRGRINQINEIFKVRAFDQKDRPTNGEFIALIADKLLLEGVS